jgi:hypothetical protein
MLIIDATDVTINDMSMILTSTRYSDLKKSPKLYYKSYITKVILQKLYCINYILTGGGRVLGGGGGRGGGLKTITSTVKTIRLFLKL